MSEDEVELPEPHRVISMARFDDPVAVIADTEAWRARESYPTIMGRGPMFALVEQEIDGRWRVVSCDEGNPQGSRDSLAYQCRMRAKAAEDAGDEEARQAWLAGAKRMDWEKLNELTVRDRRFRVVRGDMFIRMGPDGPEPPRPSDPDPMPIGKGHQGARRTRGFLIDPAAATGLSEGILKIDLLGFVYPAAAVPPDAHRDSLRALRTHPGGVLLPPVYCVSEFHDGDWSPLTAGAETPQAIRDTLVTYFRVVAPRTQKLDDETVERFERAAKRMETKRRDEIQVAGRRYRVTRVERLIRVGPDGPEPPRASEWDPELPAEAQAELDRANGIVYGED
ncbi:DUF5954 family protein [Streptomyces sp. B1866]|uniref:DUF5954 family protein n=1 Tax=Streptomyces sp. B1866 TaxID=3075431 RepID=UPI002891421C|nr:DUF5954 family protein [Streptomyces sp. B1866]MDT3397016.1 DUF5954 family protein [Streptomyces sp. B1866]